MRFSALSLICFAFGILLVAAMAFYRRKDKVSLLFVLFSCSVVGWALVMGMWLQENESVERTYFLMRISTAFATVVPLTWFHFISLFVANKWLSRKLYIALYFAVFSLALLSLLHPDFVLKPERVGLYYDAPYPGYLYHFKTILYLTFVPFGFFVLYDAFRKSNGEKRNQIKYFIIATLLGFAGGGNTIVSVYFRDASNALVPLILAYPFFMGFALIRYGFFEQKDIAHAAHKDKLATIGTLAASLNHEIKNPLYIIQSLADSFLSSFHEGLFSDKPDQLNKKAVEALKKSREQVERATQIMNQFSGFAKQRVSEAPQFKALSLHHIVEQILPLVSYEIKLDQIIFQNKINPHIGNVYADKNYTEEIFFNLIMNACQAMKDKGGKLAIHAEVENKHVKVSIQDNGPGMAKKQLDQIFEPFYTTKEEGTGLGLYITKQLVERNGGAIKVESQENEGTIFFLTFPLAERKA
jgi:signal transduction histidine kinase